MNKNSISAEYIQLLNDIKARVIVARHNVVARQKDVDLPSSITPSNKSNAQDCADKDQNNNKRGFTND